MNISIVGAKAAGKTTQITRLRENFNLLYFSPSQMFRDGFNTRTELGLLAESHMSRGELVPDDYVNSMLEAWLWQSSPQQGIVFDGFPRTTYQAEFLENSFKDMSRTFDSLIYLDVSDDVANQRLAGRRACFVCKEEFHLESAPFSICPYKKCAGQFLKPLPENQPNAISSTVNNFRQGIQPVLDYYKAKGKLLVIDGAGDSDEVHKAILNGIPQV